MEREGRVIAVCLAPTKRYPKLPQVRAIVSPHGIEGDAHAGPMRESHTNPGTFKPNDRAISIVADEVRRDINERLGLSMQPGDFNENLLVEGLGDLHDFEGDEELHFEGGVILKVTEQNKPCTKLEDHNGRGLIKQTLSKTTGTIYNRRGLVAVVVNPGILKPREKIQVK